MIMGEDLKNEIRINYRTKQYDKAIKQLMDYKMRYYSKLKYDSDRVFIGYCLSMLFYMKGEEYYNVANFHLKELDNIFSNQISIIDMEEDYYKYMWLNININHKSMSKTSIFIDLSRIYNYYLEIDMVDVAITARETLSFHMGNEEGMLEAIKTLMKTKIRDRNFIDSILRDCEKISNSLYIKALQIVEQSSIQMVSHF